MAIEKTVIPFCGYPIYKISTGEILNDDELTFLRQLENQSSRFPEGINIRLTKDVNILNNNELKRIKDIVWNNFCDYVDNVLEIKNEFYVCNSWSSVQKKGDFHPKHHHTNAVFSSVLYVQATNSIISFSVKQSKIMEGYLIDYKIKNYNHFNSLFWDVPVQSGDWIIFPGELDHETQIYTGNTDRLIIGANYFVKGDLGSDDNYNSISV